VVRDRRKDEGLAKGGLLSVERVGRVRTLKEDNGSEIEKREEKKWQRLTNR
jgi:hypothetical protein